jgi:hypothetical protein
VHLNPVWDGDADTPEVLMVAQTTNWDVLIVQKKSMIGIEMQFPDSEGSVDSINPTAKLSDLCH